MGIGGNYTQVQLLGRPHPEGVSFFFTQLGVRAIEAYALDGLQFFPKGVLAVYREFWISSRRPRRAEWYPVAFFLREENGHQPACSLTSNAGQGLRVARGNVRTSIQSICWVGSK